MNDVRVESPEAPSVEINHQINHHAGETSSKLNVESGMDPHQANTDNNLPK